MTPNSIFVRKIIYLGAIALLLIPIYQWSHPATSANAQGGRLSALRKEHRLSPSELGEIDPASETMKLATLGMKGVAANLLWSRAIHYKKVEDWDKFKATLDQITKIQPHFVSVWRFQSWNIAYNVSVEFDDYRHRYQWVRKGLTFLLKGVDHNREEPMLYWQLGWDFGQKIGRADERNEFRHQFREDEIFHRAIEPYIGDRSGWLGYDNRPDNWKAALEWYLKSQELVDPPRNVPLKKKNPLVFHSHPGMAQMKYAEAIEEEHRPGQQAKEAWRQAEELWDKFGERVLTTSIGGHRLRLAREDEYVEQAARLRWRRLAYMAPNLEPWLEGFDPKLRIEAAARRPSAPAPGRSGRRVGHVRQTVWRCRQLRLLEVALPGGADAHRLGRPAAHFRRPPGFLPRALGRGPHRLRIGLD